MSLSPGARLGPYEISAPLGAGGMGEVYRATDTNLGRQVAIKVLPDAVAQDPERLARFDREARTLAALSHPNIAAIYGLERAGGQTALVMELVEGPTLADRIGASAKFKVESAKSEHGTGLPLDEALSIAKQIAEALEAAHERGIVHRDLKPANVKVRPDGAVKVLDFGLAKAMEPASAHGASVGQARSEAPTITTPAMTQAGLILGTAAYMSPEQARGKPTDTRTDIWAFGCVLFEMVTGERAFGGEDIGETLAAVIKEAPRLDKVPARIRPLLQHCLEKDPKKRLRHIGDMDLLLTQPAPEASGGRRGSWMWPAAVMLLLAAVASSLAVLYPRQPVPAQASLRFQIPAPGNDQVDMFVLSPDSTVLAFVADDGGQDKLWLHAMDSLESRALAGTEGATYPFWSPDGQSLAFFAEGRLKKIAVAGGPALTLTEAPSGRGGTWGENGVIVFSAGPSSPILRVSSAGGEATPVTRMAGDAEGHRFPAFLPDGVHFLFSAARAEGGSGLFIGSLDGATPTRLLPDETNALFAPAGSDDDAGFVLFRRDETLMALPFDPSSLTAVGGVFPLGLGSKLSDHVGRGRSS